MTASREDFMQRIASDAFDAVVRQAIETFFQDRWGYSDKEDVTKALREAVTKMIESDKDIQARIRKRLIGIIDRGESRA